MWFKNRDIAIIKKKVISNLHGYVLPHAGTKYTGKILSETLRFRPKKKFENILIVYLPANFKENVIYNKKKYYHEYFVLYMTLKKVFGEKNYIGYNLNKKNNTDISNLNKNNTLFVISSDFSHYLSFNRAIEIENCGAISMMHKVYNTRCSDFVDHKRSFKFISNLLPKTVLQWIGRTRSPGKSGVGYLSFLIRDKPKPNKTKPDAFFITAYDKTMKERECLGNLDGWSRKKEKILKKKVINLAKTTSRLTNGMHLEVPITNYTITYLYESRNKKFIRGWHAIKYKALYLPDVFLKHTHNNGDWITNSDNIWKFGKFNMKQTYKKLHIKSRKYNKTVKNKEKKQLYYSEVDHHKIKAFIGD